MMFDIDDHYSKTKDRVKRAHHMSKPCADNTVVFTDPDGRWIFEVYLPKAKHGKATAAG